MAPKSVTFRRHYHLVSVLFGHLLSHSYNITFSMFLYLVSVDMWWWISVCVCVCVRACACSRASEQLTLSKKTFHENMSAFEGFPN